IIPRKNPRPARAAAAVIVGLLLAAPVLSAQTNVVMLWPNGAPGSESWTRKEAEYPVGSLKAVRNVVNPSITVYLPSAETATGTSVVVAPGGGFRMLSWDSEGTQAAEWLAVRGFVLTSRLTDTGTDEEFAQSQTSAAAGRGAGLGLGELLIGSSVGEAGRENEAAHGEPLGRLCALGVPGEHAEPASRRDHHRGSRGGLSRGEIDRDAGIDDVADGFETAHRVLRLLPSPALGAGGAVGP